MQDWRCGVFFVNIPGEYVLYKGLEDLHNGDDDGILMRADPAVAGEHFEREHGFDRCQANGGPGQPLDAYLPKKETWHKKLEASLQPSEASKAAVKARGAGTQQRTQRGAQCLRVREKRLSADLWRCDGKEYRGSHFPICAFTNNVGRRSAEKLAAHHGKSKYERT